MKKNNTNQNLDLTDDEIHFILSPKAIRDRAEKIFQLSKLGHTSFQYHPEKFQPTVDYVLQVINKNYPDLNIPFHSRWGHFRAGKIDRAAMLDQQIKTESNLEKARIKLDLVITSVLLDAGAGADWKYFEESSKQNFQRSEGLGVASYYMFCSGVMSADRHTCQADQKGLGQIQVEDLKKYFQVTNENPLVGVEGRVQLLNNLSKAMDNKTIFPKGRPGSIIDYLSEKYGNQIPATAILRAVLDGLGCIWPGRLMAHGVNLGDVWKYGGWSFNTSDANKTPDAKLVDSLVPIHKLSQWMTYSLIEPINEAGFEVTGVDQLTGLAEYRNGGLMLDAGLISFRNSEDALKSWSPDSDLIIEWRALTIYLLDQIGHAVQKSLNKSSQEFPLAKVLEGGTWWAGRYLAQEKRLGGTPPLNIISDGTVF